MDARLVELHKKKMRVEHNRALLRRLRHTLAGAMVPEVNALWAKARQELARNL